MRGNNFKEIELYAEFNCLFYPCAKFIFAVSSYLQKTQIYLFVMDCINLGKNLAGAACMMACIQGFLVVKIKSFTIAFCLRLHI